MHDLAQEGVALVEAHTSDANLPAAGLVEKLGFGIAEYGTVFEKLEGVP
jgi:hypothetical protein